MGRTSSLAAPLTTTMSHRGSMRELQSWHRPRGSDDNLSEYSDADRPPMSRLSTMSFGQLLSKNELRERTPTLITSSTNTTASSDYSDADCASIIAKRTVSNLSSLTRQSSYAESQHSRTG